LGLIKRKSQSSPFSLEAGVLKTKYQISYFVLSLVLGLFVSQAKAENCISDFHVQQKTMRNGLSKAQLRKLQTYSDQKKTAEGWRWLGHHGDPYAAFAYKIVATPATDQEKLFHELVRDHWLNTVGRKQYAQAFKAVAVLHFQHYNQILQTGYWPDSDQILNSYLAASRSFKLPDIVIFDSAWSESGIEFFQSWEDLLGLSPLRVVGDSRVCTHTNPFEAFFVIAQDMFDLVF
jgi:hypothetical protein